MKVYLWPRFEGADDGDGGVRRVVEAQLAGLPEFGIDFVDNPDDAEVIGCHIMIPPQFLVSNPRKPIVAFCHGLYWAEYEWANWALKANEDVMELIRIADYVTAPSEWVANAIRRHTARRMAAVPHGIDLALWTPGNDLLSYVLWNKTRPDPVCDPAPMNKVAELMPDVQFVSTFGEVASNVKLTGRLPFEQAKSLIEKAGVYLCTARETFGIGTLEALACGVPVVGYRWGGQAEFIEHGVDGWLVDPGDTMGLVQGVRWALQNRARLIEPCRAKAEQFPWRESNRRYAEIIAETAEIGRKRSASRYPRVSIVVTAYKLEKYLNDCLASVAEQDGAWECIVVDDASPDACGAIADAWAAKDKHFRVIHNKTNQYLARARNTAIEVAKGSYILPLDADDMLAPGTVKTLMKALDDDRTTHIAYGNVEFVDEDGTTPTDYEVRGKEPGYSGWPIPFDFDIQSRGGNCLPYASMYRREVWELTGGYRARCRTAEDADFWLRASSYGFRPKLVTDADTLIYRNRPGSMSRSVGSRPWERWFPWGQMIELAPAGAVTKKQLPVEAMEPMLIAVVIPVGPDHVDLLMDAIDSVDAQSYRSWECIVVNDSGKELPSLPSWVHVLSTGGRQGVAYARNLGIKASRAPLFLPLDADDYLMPDALKWMIDAFFDTGDIIYPDFWEDPYEEGKFTVYELPDFDAHLLARSGTIHSVVALTPKVVWHEVGGYDETLPAWEDWAFQIACADKGYCSRRLAAPLFVYRKHTGSRARQNVQDFDRSKQGIMSKWPELWEPGGKELAGCGCSSPTIKPSQASGPMTASMLQPQGRTLQGNVTLIRYTGGKSMSSPWRAPSGTIYRFSVGDPPSYVFSEDAEWFMRWPHDFAVVDGGAEPLDDAVAAQASPSADGGPLLVAEGPPR